MTAMWEPPESGSKERIRGHAADFANTYRGVAMRSRVIVSFQRCAALLARTDRGAGRLRVFDVRRAWASSSDSMSKSLLIPGPR